MQPSLRIAFTHSITTFPTKGEYVSTFLVMSSQLQTIEKNLKVQRLPVHHPQSLPFLSDDFLEGSYRTHAWSSSLWEIYTRFRSYLRPQASRIEYRIQKGIQGLSFFYSVDGSGPSFMRSSPYPLRLISDEEKAMQKRRKEREKAWEERLKETEQHVQVEQCRRSLEDLLYEKNGVLFKNVDQLPDVESFHGNFTVDTFIQWYIRFLKSINQEYVLSLLPINSRKKDPTGGTLSYFDRVLRDLQSILLRIDAQWKGEPISKSEDLHLINFYVLFVLSMHMEHLFFQGYNPEYFDTYMEKVMSEYKGNFSNTKKLFWKIVPLLDPLFLKMVFVPPSEHSVVHFHTVRVLHLMKVEVPKSSDQEDKQTTFYLNNQKRVNYITRYDATTDIKWNNNTWTKAVFLHRSTSDSETKRTIHENISENRNIFHQTTEELDASLPSPLWDATYNVPTFCEVYIPRFHSGIMDAFSIRANQKKYQYTFGSSHLPEYTELYALQEVRCDVVSDSNEQLSSLKAWTPSLANLGAFSGGKWGEERFSAFPMRLGPHATSVLRDVPSHLPSSYFDQEGWR